MRGSFSLLFYPKGATIDKSGKALIYLRITVDSKRNELSIKRRIKPLKWNSSMGKPISRGLEEKELVRYMSSIRSSIYKIHETLVTKGKSFSSEMIKSIYLNKDVYRKTLLKVFQEHNEQIESLIGKDYSSGCFKRYVRTKNHIADFIKKEYRREDIFLGEINLEFINRFEYYLKVKNIGNHNTITKYITNFKKIVRTAYANDWISKDPFFHWKAKWKAVEREFLSELEVRLLMKKEISITRLDQVRDIFLFCCFTGLAYADVKKLSHNNIIIAVDGDRWIKIRRSKTDTRSSIPLLPIAESILSKYEKYSEKLNSERLLPVISNQRMNGYLKEIANICDIKKNLTFHLARHTFATTVTLTNGVPIESVSKMLGHKSLKTTQIYAKVIDSKLRNDMQVLKNKFTLDNDSSYEINENLKVASRKT